MICNNFGGYMKKSQNKIDTGDEYGLSTLISLVGNIAYILSKYEIEVSY
jgi:hypothetical protein